MKLEKQRRLAHVARRYYLEDQKQSDIARELGISALRLIAVDNGRVIAAGWSGKVKTACTMVGIILMLIFPNATLRLVCVAVILVTTIYSGIEYFVKNKDVIASA